MFRWTDGIAAYSQFTCTHKIRDFVKEQNSGIPNPFPMIEMIKGALVYPTPSTLYPNL